MKPAFTIFVGVGSDGFEEKDLQKLPTEVRRAYTLLPEWGGDSVTVEEVELQSFDFGRDYSADPGEFAGFGVCIFDEWFDSGTSVCDPQKIHAETMKMLPKIESLFQKWGLQARPQVFSFCHWGS